MLPGSYKFKLDIDFKLTVDFAQHLAGELHAATTVKNGFQVVLRNKSIIEPFKFVNQNPADPVTQLNQTLVVTSPLGRPGSWAGGLGLPLETIIT